MPLDPRTAPDREMVKAYMLTFGQEWAKPVLADLETFVRVNMASKKDRLDRIDPFQVVAQEAARRVLERIHAMSSMHDNPEWQAIERTRQMAAAQQKAKGQGS